MQYYSKIDYKRRLAADYLGNLLAKLPPGGKLPGLRMMIAQSGVGRTLLEEQLQYLLENNSIEVKFRQGYYKHQLAGDPQVLYLHEMRYPGKVFGFTDKMYAAIREIAQARQLAMKFVNIADMDEVELLEILKYSAAEMVFLGGQRDISRAAFVRKNVRYCVEMLPRHSQTLGAELRNAPATPLQMEYLLQRSYTKIAYIHQVDDWNNTPTQLMRLLDYYRIMSGNHLQIYPEWVFKYHYEWSSFNRSMYQMMNSKHPPEAVIAPGCCLVELYEYCANNGIKVGSELAIMGCDDTEPYLSPRPTVVTNNPAEMAQQMWEIMDALQQGRELHREIDLKIITGETVPVHQMNL